MALGFYITAKGFTQERYDTTLVQLEEAGAGAPNGRISHVALETDGEIRVFDIWESQEAFEAFGATLLPILAAAGVEMNEPMVADSQREPERLERRSPAVLRAQPRANHPPRRRWGPHWLRGISRRRLRRRYLLLPVGLSVRS